MMGNQIVATKEWEAAYPKARIGILALRGVANPASSAALDHEKERLESALRERFAGQTRADIASLPEIRAYDEYYKRFDKTYHVQLQLESVAFKGKAIPRVAALVEAMFVAELKNLLLTAGHDLAALRGAVRIGVASGSERYTLLNGKEQALKDGDMYIADEKGIISSIVYGPDQRTRITPATTEVLFTVYGVPGIGDEAIRAHLRDIQRNVQLVSPTAETRLLAVVAATL